MDETTHSADEMNEETEFYLPFYGNLRDAMIRYSHCVLCGGNLHFSHVTDFGKNLTQESAKCPECGIRVRSMLHKLQ